MDDGLKVSSVADADEADDRQLNWTSEFTSYKIFKTSLNGLPQEISVPIAVFPVLGSATATINHSLGYSPSFLIWLKDTNNYWHFTNSDGYLLDRNAGGLSTGAFYCYSNNQDLFIEFFNSDVAGGHTVKYHYAILYDPST